VTDQGSQVTYTVVLTLDELVAIRRALGRAPHDQVRPLIENIAAQVEHADAQRAASATPSGD